MSIIHNKDEEHIEMPKKKLKSLPSAQEFFVTTPLYKKYSFDEYIENFDKIGELLARIDAVDTYCSSCKGKDSATFVHTNPNRYNTFDHGVTNIIFQCSRCKKEHLRFFVLYTHDFIIKIGQYPSLADLELFSTKKYDKILPVEKRKEFTKAVGLASHEIFVGSFVYLRRIFEFLIEEVHQTVKAKDKKWDEAKYKKQKWDGKIALLAKSLPTFLVEHKKIYSILSLGIHELEESKCADYFTVMKESIEIILDEKLAEYKLKQHKKNTSKAIKNILSDYKD